MCCFWVFLLSVGHQEGLWIAVGGTGRTDRTVARRVAFWRMSSGADRTSCKTRAKGQPVPPRLITNQILKMESVSGSDPELSDDDSEVHSDASGSGNNSSDLEESDSEDDGGDLPEEPPVEPPEVDDEDEVSSQADDDAASESSEPAAAVPKLSDCFDAYMHGTSIDVLGACGERRVSRGAPVESVWRCRWVVQRSAGGVSRMLTC